MRQLAFILSFMFLTQLFLGFPTFEAKEAHKLLKEINQPIDNLAQNESNWQRQGDWTFDASKDYDVSLLSNSDSGDLIWFESEELNKSWQIYFTLEMLSAPNSEGEVVILVGNNRKASIINLVLTRHPAGLCSVTLKLNNGLNVMHSGWIPGNDKKFAITITKPSADSKHLQLDIRGDNTFVYKERTPDLLLSSQQLKGFGLYAEGFDLAVSNVVINAGYTSGDKYMEMAMTGVNDLIENFWHKGPTVGHIKPTWCGYVDDKLPDKRGMLWERSTMVFPIFSLYQATDNPLLKEYLISEWNYIKSNFTLDELAAAGSSLHPAVDDSGWASMMYINLYLASGDPDALLAAQNIVDNAFERWFDDEMGGGLWYNNNKRYKSIYQCGILTTAMNIWELTDDEEYEDKFFKLYNWIEEKLRRDDGIYWVDYYPNGPDGYNRQDYIQEAGSVSSLMANMAMGIVNARLFDKTGDEKYKQLAIDTAEGIYLKETTQDGIYINDRDAWANGTFVSEWAKHVLTLQGIDEKHKEVLYKTADSILLNARTKHGHYGGSWSGPCSGMDSAWYVVGSRPEQIMTSGNTVNMLVAAAITECLER